MATPKTLEPSVKGTIIKQDRKTLYFDAGSEALYRNFDIHFVKYEWIHLSSWNNRTDQTSTFEYTAQDTLAVTGVDVINAEWGLRDVLKGITAAIDGSTVTITENVTSKEPGTTVATKVWPNSSVHLYRKKYTLDVVMWFQLDFLRELFTVGMPESDNVTMVKTTVEVDASDYLMSPKTLFGPSLIFVAPASDVNGQTNIRQRQRCTDKSQKYLRDRGI